MRPRIREARPHCQSDIADALQLVLARLAPVGRGAEVVVDRIFDS
jgi:hypothetical protein